MARERRYYDRARCYKLLDQGKFILPATRPKCSNHRGRTWDSISVILPDGKKTMGYLDTTWGVWVYYEMDGKWKKTQTSLIGQYASYASEINLKAIIEHEKGSSS